MHQIIQHSGICRRLDCWRVEVQRRNPTHRTLELYAATNPSLEELQQVANHLAMNYTDRKRELHQMRAQPENIRDKQFENNLLLNEYFLLYEELAFAMNYGDIARVESCFLPWVWIFKATGKHKYVKHMLYYLADVHYKYPPGLK